MTFAHWISTDAALEAFIQINPAFQTTLRTRGGRGAQLWAYLKGDRPRKIHKLKVDKHSPLAAGLKEVADNEGRVSIGEFRAEGGQSVICGIHPSGFNYTWLVSNPPITIAFDRIRWPNDVTIPWEEPRRGSSHGSSDSSDLLQRAIENVTVTFLWTHFNYPQRRQNPTHSPFRTDRHPSFSIYDEGRRFKDHAYEAHRGDSFNFYQLAMGQDARTAFEGFIELAGLGAELRKNKTKSNQFAGADTDPAKRADNAAESNGSAQSTGFDWKAYRRLSEAERERLSKWRGYSPEFVAWLSKAGLIRVSGNNSTLSWAFPLHKLGKIVGVHSRPVEWKGEGPRALEG